MLYSGTWGSPPKMFVEDCWDYRLVFIDFLWSKLSRKFSFKYSALSNKAMNVLNRILRCISILSYSIWIIYNRFKRWELQSYHGHKKMWIFPVCVCSLETNWGGKLEIVSATDRIVREHLRLSVLIYFIIFLIAVVYCQVRNWILLIWLSVVLHFETRHMDLTSLRIPSGYKIISYPNWPLQRAIKRKLQYFSNSNIWHFLNLKLLWCNLMCRFLNESNVTSNKSAVLKRGIMPLPTPNFSWYFKALLYMLRNWAGSM